MSSFLSELEMIEALKNYLNILRSSPVAFPLLKIYQLSDVIFTIDAPGWTFNPPSNQDINSAMMTHFTVRPATRHKNQVHACA